MSEKAICPNDIPQESFKDYLFKRRNNRMFLWTALGISIFLFSLFKHLYPFASYIHADSFFYIEAAYENSDINKYMIGYSRFLRLFSVFSSVDAVLVAFQYLLIQSGALFFLLTLFYFYNTSKPIQLILFFFMVLNPLFLYLANLVSSDGLFLGLSFTWFAMLLWIIHKPNIYLLIGQALVLFLLFTLRYNALIYPVITITALYMSGGAVRKKIIGALVSFLLIGIFIFYTGNRYKRLTGTWQYAPFSGWQLANNAMYAYRYVKSEDRKPVPEKFNALDNVIREYFDSTRDVARHPLERLLASTFYMWSPGLPLYKYHDIKFNGDSTSSELKKWASMAPLYSSYGAYIIRNYPWYYARYFLWVNAQKYYAPPLEFLSTYNSGIDSVAPIAQRWFRYNSPIITSSVKNMEIGPLNIYPILSGVMNVVFLCNILCFTLLKGFRSNLLLKKGTILAIVTWLLNAGFIVFSASAALRFLAFPILLMCTFVLLLMECVWRGTLTSDAEEVATEIVLENLQTSKK